MSLADALHRVDELLGSDSLVKTWLRAAEGWPRFEVLCDHFKSASDRETLLDHAATLRYGRIFSDLGFSTACEPQGESGPDLAISRDSLDAEVEVTRFRPIHAGPTSASEEETLEAYGNPQRDIGKVMRKISKKFKQTKAARALIAIWNDDGDLEDIEVELATDALRSAGDLPTGLQAVVYASDWVEAGSGRQFRGYFIRHPDHQVGEWIRELENI